MLVHIFTNSILTEISKTLFEAPLNCQDFAFKKKITFSVNKTIKFVYEKKFPSEAPKQNKLSNCSNILKCVVPKIYHIDSKPLIDRNNYTFSYAFRNNNHDRNVVPFFKHDTITGKTIITLKYQCIYIYIYSDMMIHMVILIF